LYHKPSGVSFLSFVEVVIPSFILLNQLIVMFQLLFKLSFYTQLT